MGFQDDSAAQDIAALPWVADGITTREAGVLDDLSWLILDNPEIAETVMLYQWLGPEGNPMLDDRRALRAIRATADVDPDLGATLSRYPWIAAGPDRQESQALELVAELASPDYRKQTATGIGAIRVSAIAPNTPRPSESRLHPIAEIIADYSWLRDDVTRSEYQVLGAMSNLVNNSKLLSTGFHEELLSVAWLQDNVNQTEIEALERWSNLIEVAEITGTLAGRTIWEYEWAQDDATPDEISFITRLTELTTKPGHINADGFNTIASYDWVQDGIDETDSRALSYYERLFKNASAGHIGVMPIILEYEWIADGISSSELSRVDKMRSLLNANSRPDSTAIVTILNYRWLADSIETSEYDALKELTDLLRLEQFDGVPVPQALLEYSWLADDITSTESIGLKYLSDSVRFLSPEQPAAMDSVLAYEWVRDGISQSDIDSLNSLVKMFEQTRSNTGEFIAILASRPWVRDGIDHDESELLHYFEYLNLLADLPQDVTMPSIVVTYPWLDDGITLQETQYVWTALNFVQNLSPIAPDTMNTVLENSSSQSPDMLGEGSISLHRLGQAIVASDRLYGDLTQDILDLPWLLDGITEIERLWLHWYTDFLEELDGESAELVQSLLQRAWVQDGISDEERLWMYVYVWLLEESDPAARPIVLNLAYLDRFQDGIDRSDAKLIESLADSNLLHDPEIAAQDWFEDGLSERDLIILIAFADALDRSQYQYQDLLREFHVAERTIDLPLAGETGLYVVRHTEFPRNDPTLDLMEDIARQLEHFMGIPFPLHSVLIAMIEPSIRNGEDPQYGVGYARGAHISMVPPRLNPDFHLAVFHEMTHLYWGGHTGAPSWWTEGAAGFLPDIARDALGHETLEERHHQLLWDTRNECWYRGIANISRYYHLQKTEPQVARDRGICIYAFGEVFLIEMYLLLGRDATSAAMRHLYVDARDSGWHNPITDQRIYDAFRANTPEDKMADFHDLFDRLHGGANVTIPETSDA